MTKEQAEAFSKHLVTHGKGILNGSSHVCDVPGINQDGASTQRLGCPCKLAKHQDTCTKAAVYEAPWRYLRFLWMICFKSKQRSGLG